MRNPYLWPSSLVQAMADITVGIYFAIDSSLHSSNEAQP